VGAQILQRLGATAQTVREAVTMLADSELAAEVTEAPLPQPRAVAMGSPLRIRVEALAEVTDLLASIDRRLSAIERHLGIDADREEPPTTAPEAAAPEAEAEVPEGEAEAE
jgi:hypothetical protein